MTGRVVLLIIFNAIFNAKQYINIDEHHSTAKDVMLGVPEGSLLCPVLFPVLINELPSALQHLVVNIYADDTTLRAPIHYTTVPQALNDVFQVDIHDLSKWSTDNKMILNESKTKMMIVTGKWLLQKIKDSSLQVQLNFTKLDQVTLHKLLGLCIYVDSQFLKNISYGLTRRKT